MAITYEPIATVNGTGSGTTLSFSSIPATYTDLRVVIQATSPASGQYISPAMRFNSDSASNYSYINMWGDTGTVGGFRTSNSTLFPAGVGQIGVQNLYPCMSVIDILGYAGSTFKPSLISASVATNTSSSAERTASMWRSTSAITAISIISQGDPFSTSTIATLYGIKAA